MTALFSLTKIQQEILRVHPVLGGILPFFQGMSTNLNQSYNDIRTLLEGQNLASSDIDAFFLVISGGGNSSYYASYFDESSLRRIRNALNGLFQDSSLNLGDAFYQSVRVLSEQYEDLTILKKTNLAPSLLSNNYNYSLSFKQWFATDHQFGVYMNDIPTNETLVFGFGGQPHISNLRAYELFDTNGDKYNISIGSTANDGNLDKLILTPIAGKIKSGNVILLKVMADLANGIPIDNLILLQFK